MYNNNDDSGKLVKASYPESHIKRLLADTGLFALSNFGSKFLVFFLAPLYTYVLSTEEYGTADLIQTTVTFLYPLLTLSISEAVLRFAMDKGTNRSEILNTGLLFITSSSVLLACAYPIGARILLDLQPFWFAFVAYYLLYNLQDCFGNYVKAIGKTKIFAFMGILHTGVLLCCSMLFLLVFHWGLKGYIASILFSTAVASVYLFVGGEIYKEMAHPRIERRLVIEMLRYSLPLMPAILSWSINTNIDKYMIISLYGIGASGIYSIAHKIPSILTMILNVFLQAWQLNAISIRNEAGEENYYNNVYSAMKTFCILLCVVMIPFSKMFTKLLFSSAYFEAWKYMPMLILSALFSALSGFLAAPFRAYKKSEGLFISVGIGAVVNITLNAILLSNIGVVGAAIATAVSFMVVWWIRLCTVQKHVRIQRKWNEWVAYIILFAIAAALTFEYPCAYALFVVGSIAIIILLKNEIVMIHRIAGKVLQSIMAKIKR